MLDHPLQAGAAELDITPPLGTLLAGSFEERRAEDIHDPLLAKAVVIESEGTRIALVALDLIAIMGEEVQKIRRRIAEHTDIPPEHVMIGCTHTHTGPLTRDIRSMKRDEAYIDWVVTRAADSVRLALRRVQPARISWGRGEQHDISFCRRFRMRDGTVRMNPKFGDPDIVEPVSPIDPAVGVLYIQDIHGNPLAVVAQFSLHYVGTDDSNAVSADYYGYFAEVMRSQLGPECVPLLLNGTSGQIINSNRMGKPGVRGDRQARRVATALAGEVLKVIARSPLVEACDLAVASMTVELTRKRITDADVAMARRILQGDRPGEPSGPFSYVVGSPIPEAMWPIYSEHVLGLAQMPTRIPAEVQVLRIGESAWVALPGEIFTEIGLAIKDDSPVPNTFVVGIANDFLGYIPTDRAFAEEGGYETWARTGAPVGPGAEGILVSAAGELLGRLFGRKSVQVS